MEKKKETEIGGAWMVYDPFDVLIFRRLVGLIDLVNRNDKFNDPLSKEKDNEREEVNLFSQPLA